MALQDLVNQIKAKRAQQGTSQNPPVVWGMPGSNKPQITTKFTPAQPGLSPIEAPRVKPMDVVKEIPGTVKRFAKEIAQGTARTVGTVGITAANAVYPKGKKPFPSEIPTSGNKVTRAVFGGETIKDIPTYGKAGIDELKKMVGLQGVEP